MKIKNNKKFSKRFPSHHLCISAFLKNKNSGEKVKAKRQYNVCGCLWFCLTLCRIDYNVMKLILHFEPSIMIHECKFWEKKKERKRQIEFISISISGPQRPKELGMGSGSVDLAQTSRSISHLILFRCLFNHVYYIYTKLIYII